MSEAVVHQAADLDRIPPNNLEAEMAALGAMLVDRAMIPIVFAELEPADFYAPSHEHIASALASLYRRDVPTDKIALAEELRRRGHLQHEGGLAYLSGLMRAVPTAANARYYAGLVREKSVLRQVIAAATRIAERAYAGEGDVDAAVRDATEDFRATLQRIRRPRPLAAQGDAA